MFQVISPFQIELLSEQINSSLDGGGTWQEHELTCRGEGQGSVIPQIIWSIDDYDFVRNFIFNIFSVVFIQRSKEIRQWPINYCTSPMMIHKNTFSETF